MEGTIPTAVVVLGVLCVALAVIATTRPKRVVEASPPDEVSSEPVEEASSNERVGHRRHSWLITGLLGSLILNGLLVVGYLNLDTRMTQGQDRLDAQAAAAEAEMDRKVEEVEDRLSRATAQALAQLPDIAAVRSDLSQLEKAIFGWQGSRFENDALGDLNNALEGRVSSVVSCFNRLISNAFDSYDRASASTYFRTYYVGRCF